MIANSKVHLPHGISSEDRSFIDLPTKCLGEEQNPCNVRLLECAGEVSFHLTSVFKAQSQANVFEVITMRSVDSGISWVNEGSVISLQTNFLSLEIYSQLGDSATEYLTAQTKFDNSRTSSDFSSVKIVISASNDTSLIAVLYPRKRSWRIKSTIY